jgi:hypothetical protein
MLLVLRAAIGACTLVWRYAVCLQSTAMFSEGASATNGCILVHQT